MAKVMRGIDVTKTLSRMLPWHFLSMLCKSFVDPHLDYDEKLYDHLNNKSLCQKIETTQCNAAPVITSAIRGRSQMKLYS